MSRLTTKFSGTFVALITPFEGGAVDLPCFARLVERQVRSGVDGIVVCGTTGESSTLLRDEQERLIETAVAISAGRTLVVAGTGSNSTAEAIVRTRRAAKIGADAALLICPYYNRPTQDGLFHHFSAIATATDLPLILYNLPSRTAVNLEPLTLLKLVEYAESFVAIKEGSGSLEHMTEIIRLCGEKLSLLSSDDVLTLPCISIGGKGVISTIANVVPAAMVRLTTSSLAGNMATAAGMHHQLYPLMKASFVETNPIPIKEIMAQLGMIAAEYRLPLCPAKPSNKEMLASIIKGLRPIIEAEIEK